MTRTDQSLRFNLCPFVWFYLDVKDTSIVGMEEHDWYSGGVVQKPDFLTWKEFFVESVKDRCSADYRAKGEVLAIDFLKENGL